MDELRKFLMSVAASIVGCYVSKWFDWMSRNR